ncbi:Uncharacterised protein [Staphylococcus aureus]|nr:Uncharacterised protein [Staphylococcus aureus]
MKLGSILLPSFFIIFIEADFLPVSVLGLFPQLTLFVEIEDPIFLCCGPFPQFAMSVEIGNPIPLCWSSANLHEIVS